MDIEQVISRAEECIRKNQKPQARALLREALRQYPNRAEVWSLSAQVTDDPGYAQYCLSQASKLNPNSHIANDPVSVIHPKPAPVPSQIIMKEVEPAYTPGQVPAQKRARWKKWWFILMNLGGLTVVAVIIALAIVIAGRTRVNVERLSEPITESKVDLVQEVGLITSKPLLSQAYGTNTTAISPDGQTLATGVVDGSIQLFQVSNGKLLNTWNGHNANIYSVAFSPDGATLASIAVDENIRLWRVSDGQLIRTLDMEAHRAECIAFSPDGMFLASGTRGQIRLWRLPDGTDPLIWDTGDSVVSSIAFSPDGQILVSGSPDGSINLWQFSYGAYLYALQEQEPVQSVAISPDGQILASGSADGTIRLYRVSDGELIRKLVVEKYQRVASIAFSPDGTVLASGWFDETIRLFRVSDGQLLRTMEGHDQSAYSEVVHSLTFSSDGTILVSADFTGAIRLWGVR